MSSSTISPFLALWSKEAPSACFRKVVHRVSLGHIPFWFAWLAFHLFVCFGSHMHSEGNFREDIKQWPPNVIYFHMCYFKGLDFLFARNNRDLVFGLTYYLRLIVVTARAHTTQRSRDL